MAPQLFSHDKAFLDEARAALFSTLGSALMCHLWGKEQEVLGSLLSMQSGHLHMFDLRGSIETVSRLLEIPGLVAELNIFPSIAIFEHQASLDFVIKNGCRFVGRITWPSPPQLFAAQVNVLLEISTAQSKVEGVKISPSVASVFAFTAPPRATWRSKRRRSIFGAVISESRAFREYVRRALLLENLNSRGFKSISSCKEVIRRSPPDFIIVSKDVFEIEYGQLTEIWEKYSLPTIVAEKSSETTVYDIVNALRRGSDDFILLPTDAQLLAVRVRTKLRRCGIT